MPRSNNDFPPRNFRGYAYFGYAYLFNSIHGIGVIYISSDYFPSVVVVLTIVSLLSLEDVSIYRGEALIEFRCYLRVEFRGGGIQSLLNSSIDQGRNHVHCMLSSSRKTSTSEHIKSV